MLSHASLQEVESLMVANQCKSYVEFLHMHTSWFNRVFHVRLRLTKSLEGLGIYIDMYIYIYI